MAQRVLNVVYVSWTVEHSPYQPSHYIRTRHMYNNVHAQMCDFIITYITSTRAILDLYTPRPRCIYIQYTCSTRGII